MKQFLAIISMFLLTTNAHASVARSVSADTITNTTGGSALSVPSSGSNIVSDSGTQTLTNKTISGASNTISAIPAATALSGQVPVANGGTGASTLTANNILLGNGTSAVNFVAPGSSGNVLTSNGTTWTSAAPSAFAPVVNDSAASPQSITAGTGIVLTGLAYVNYVFIEGNGGAVTVTATPSVTQCTNPGQMVYIIGKNATNTVTLQDEAGLAGSNLQLNGTWVAGLNSVLTLVCEAASGDWVEVSRR